MKVTNNPHANTSQLESTKAADKAGAKRIQDTGKPMNPATLGQEGGVEISDQARMMKEVRGLVYAAPDVRADKVSDLKRRIKDGNYAIDSAAVADKLVDEHLASNFGKNDL